MVRSKEGSQVMLTIELTNLKMPTSFVSVDHNVSADFRSL